MATIKVTLLDAKRGCVDVLHVEQDGIATAHTIVHKGVHYAYCSMPRFALREVEFQQVHAPVRLNDEGGLATAANDRPAPKVLTRSTHTYATMSVSKAAHAEVLNNLRAAGYDHAIDGGVLDMHGIALVTNEGDTNG